MTCVKCHIGPGAIWFARSKVSGLRQVMAVARNSYSRPIASPVKDLRPAREVCEQCHWPEKFHGDKIVKVAEYGDDEQNTETVTTLQVHVGGGSQRLGIATGIHWHMNVANDIEYITTDDKRQVIPYVHVKDPQGNVREYFAEGVDPRAAREQASAATWTASTATTARAIRWRPPPSVRSTRRLPAARFRERCRSSGGKPSRR